MKRFSVLAAAGLLLVTFVLGGPSAGFAQEVDPAAPADDAFGNDPAVPSDAGDPAMSEAHGFDANDFNFEQAEEWDDAAWEDEFGNAPPFNPNAPPDELIKMIIVVYGTFAAIGLVIYFSILAVICWLVSTALKAVPEQYREMSPGQVWLLMIPCFNIIWNFFVFQRVPKSFQNYFAATGQSQFGDCGIQIGLWFAICYACSVVPYLGCLPFAASLVLLIIMLVKLWGMKGEIERGRSGDDGGMMSSTLDV